MLSRPKCQSCKSVVGFHWVYNAVFLCIAAVAIGFLSLYLQTVINLSIVVKVFIFFGAALLGILLWSLSSPLEIKLNKWAP